MRYFLFLIQFCMLQYFLQVNIYLVINFVYSILDTDIYYSL